MSEFDVFRRPITLRRYEQADYIDGQYVYSGLPTVLTIRASVQPVKADELQALPEARREQSAYWLYSEDEIRGLKEGNDGLTPDMVVLDGEDYEIAQVSRWNSGVIPHYKALAVRV